MYRTWWSCWPYPPRWFVVWNNEKLFQGYCGGKAGGSGPRRVLSLIEQDSWIRPVFLQLFYSIAPFSLSKRRFRPPSLLKQTQGSKFKEFYLKKVLNSWTKPLKSWTKQLYYDASITFKILVKTIQGYGAGAGHFTWSRSSN